MSDHKTALVPIATSEHSSPALFQRGVAADTGLFAESLIYYDKVHVHYGNAHQFAAFVSRLVQQGLSYEQLIDLLDDDVIRFFTAFTAHPVCVRDVLTGEPRSDIITQFVAIQESSLKDPDYFEKKVLNTRELRSVFGGLNDEDKLDKEKERLYERFCSAAKSHSITYDADVMGSGIVNNAYDDFLNADRCKAIVSSVIQNIYYAQELSALPDFNVRVREMDGFNYDEIARNPHSTVVVRPNGDDSVRIYEVDYELPTAGLDDEPKFRRIFKTLPLSVAGVANLFVRSAGQMKSDLYLPTTMSQIIGDKLFEIDEFQLETLKRQNIIGSIEQTADFPDIYELVNQNKIGFEAVLKLRSGGKRFRDWLQQTNGGEDWQVWTAYHNETAKEAGFTRNVRKAIKMFGVLAAAAAGAAAGVATKNLTGDDAQAVGAASASAIVGKALIETTSNKIVGKLFDYGAELGTDWRPKCFGEWSKVKIEEILRNNR